MTIRPVADWPDILCGPIVRRVEPRSVSVFLATSYSATVELSIYESTDAVNLIQSVSRDTVALGERLHVCVITLGLLPPRADLQPGRVYGYDIKLSAGPAPAPTHSLADLGLLSGDAALGYVPGALPGFVLPPDLGSLMIAHGSCRKPHGGGYDALLELDDILLKNRTNSAGRPHQLFLTGDQIYADDVAEGFLRTLTETGEQLLGWAQGETIPDGTGLVSFGSGAPEVAPRTREAFTKGEAFYTSDHGENHLMFFGEFCAMYLLVWCDALWPRLADAGGRYTLTAKPGSNPPRFDGKTETAIEFATRLPRVRRVLANVPTYMVFDDHDVTDDWYLNRAWSEGVRSSHCGRRLMRNALLAYAIFQDWGNQPAQYDAGQHGFALLDRVRWDPTPRMPDIATVPDCCDDILDIGAVPVGTGNVSARMRWDFEVTGPAHRVILLDTRTWRQFPPARKGNAGLLSAAAMDFQLDARRRADGKLTFVVSAAPVFGQPLLEEVLQKTLIEANEKQGAEKYDNEPWLGNRLAFERLLNRLSRFGKAVILSGDVHYSFSTEVAYFGAGIPAPTPARLIQLCASSYRNADFMTRLLGNNLDLPFPFKEKGWMGFDDDLTPIREDLWNAVSRSIEGTIDEVEEAKIVLHYGFFVHDRFTRPAVLPTEPWVNDQALAIVSALPTRPDSEWRYHIRYLSDDRPLLVRFASSPEFVAAVGSPPGTREQLVLESNRFIVGESNLGLISVEQGPAGVQTLVHRLLWREELPGTVASTYIGPLITEHRARLATPTAAERPQVSK